MQGTIARAIVRASFRVQVTEPELLKLEIHRPDGSVHLQTFMHRSHAMACPGCDPVVGGPPDQCQNVCSMQSLGPARPRVPHEVMNQYGEYTAVLHRPPRG